MMASTSQPNIDLSACNQRCLLCYQNQPESVEIPSDAELEYIVLANESLANVFNDDFDVVQHNLFNFCIYDENNHMCSLDSGVLERNIKLYLFGCIRPVGDQGEKQGVAVKKLGPILEWWVSAFDGGSISPIGISTEYADYLLIEPHPCYKKYMTSVIEKIHLSKLVIEGIIDHQDSDDPTYEDIMNLVVNSVNPATGVKFTEEDLIAHAQFVINQVLEYDSNDTYQLPLSDTRCVETLTQLSGAIKLDKILFERSGIKSRGVEAGITKRHFSKATTTELVKDVFENVFAAQLDTNNKNNITAQSDTNSIHNSKKDPKIEKKCHDKNELYNENIDVENDLSKNMFVFIKSKDSTVPIIGRIEYLYTSTLSNKPRAHVQYFVRGHETVLNEVSDPQEIFALKKCANINVDSIIKVLEVVHKTPSNNWFNLGDSKLQDLLEPVDRNNTLSFFYQFQYDDEVGSFEYIKPDESCNNETDRYCRNCKINKNKSRVPELLEFIEEQMSIQYFYKFKLNDEEYKIGNFIYLEPGVFSKSNFKKKKMNDHGNSKIKLLKNIDEEKYPERYRKTLEYSMRGSNETTPDPFEIAEILGIYVSTTKNIMKLLVRRMYRAEQITTETNNKHLDMNMLYWSDEKKTVSYQEVYGKCYVSHIVNIKNPLEWSAGGPDRFYFVDKFDHITGTIVPDYLIPCTAKLTGGEVLGKGDDRHVTEDKLQYIPSYNKIVPLKCLDIFAGCGGLSRGLEESGLVESKWAIECDESAANAFQRNNPDAEVFIEDCNHLLKLAISGKKTNNKNQKIPQKGEVDFICGGPPCQGFSGMNRFNSGQYSLFKNSLIVSFLSYIDFYRPRYFVMENVRNFVSFKGSMILKLTLRCITRMGYQCSFGILQAGNFGVPQTRRRLIIMAAAPGEQLPSHPEPTHVFSKRSSSQVIQIDGKKYNLNCKYDKSAPLRTVTLYDAWSDLPRILNGENRQIMCYNSPPLTHLQRLLRFPKNLSSSTLSDHICKDMSFLVLARIRFIPVCEGSDWRDLPNIEVMLPNGHKTNLLKYRHHDTKNGKSSNGALRGVCQCFTNEQCNPLDRQSNTIIPWCLPHTANRHNNWAGLYGRLSWTGFCSTTITNPEPMGKQGKVLHPEQHRVVSVRECARSQGFKDSYIFCGPILNKHRQIGNAVPPPMGKAIGHAILKALA